MKFLGDGAAGSPVQVKICGITRAEDARDVVAAGADALGLVFYPPSPRYVSVAAAREIVACVDGGVSVVALFANPEPGEVTGVLDQLAIDLLQFHGTETASFCESFDRPYMKALHVREGVDLACGASPYAKAAALLLDNGSGGKWGGTGECFDWSLVPGELHGQRQPKLGLAGGLCAANVAQAIDRVRPFAVDVSGGVESTPGIKDRHKIAAFIDEVHRAGFEKH